MKLVDRARQYTTTVGTGSLTLGAVVLGSQLISSAYPIGEPLPYGIEDPVTGEWEVGSGVLTSATNLVRSFVSASSNAGAKVSFAAGTKTVHVNISAWQLSDGLVDPDDPGYDIILLIGQSNMAGRGTLDTLVEIADNRVWQFGGKSTDGRYRTIFAGNDPLHNFEYVNTGQMSLGTVACKAYASTRPGNRRVLMVPCANGGTPLFSGDANWSVGGSLYLNAIAQANAAITAAKLQYPNSRFVGCFWHQGESDTNVSQANYQTALTNAIAGYRANITGAANSWFIIGGMVPEYIATNPGVYTGVIAAQLAVASSVARCAFVEGPSGGTTDTTHFNAVGSRIMGVRMALAVRAAQQNLAVDTTAPVVSSSAVQNATPSQVQITMSEALNPAFIPAASAFTVAGHTVSGVAIASNIITLTVSTPFIFGEAARTVSYTQPGTNNVRDLADNLLINFSGAAITNNVAAADVSAPVVSSAVVANGSPSNIVITFNETLAAFTPAAAAFAVSGGKTVSNVARSGATITLTVNSPYVFGDTITCGYTKPGSNPIQDAAGNQTATFSGQTVTNNVAASDTTAPAFSSAQVANDSPTVIQITMNESLAASTPPTSAFAVSGGKTVSSVSISGLIASVTVNSAYATGDVITVTYSQPGANPRLQDAAGNPSVSFGPSAVTNNVATAVSFSVQNMGFMGATTPAGDYIGTTSGGWGSEGYGTLSVLFQSGVDGEFVVQMRDVPTRTGTATLHREIGISVDALSTTNSNGRFYTEMDHMLMYRADGAQTYTNGASGTDVTGVIPIQFGYLKMKRENSAGTATMKAQISPDGVTWSTIKTWTTGVSSGVLYGHVHVIQTSKIRLISQSGLA